MSELCASPLLATRPPGAPAWHHVLAQGLGAPGCQVARLQERDRLGAELGLVLRLPDSWASRGLLRKVVPARAGRVRAPPPLTLHLRLLHSWKVAGSCVRKPFPQTLPGGGGEAGQRLPGFVALPQHPPGSASGLARSTGTPLAPAGAGEGWKCGPPTRLDTARSGQGGWAWALSQLRPASWSRAPGLWGTPTQKPSGLGAVQLFPWLKG